MIPTSRHPELPWLAIARLDAADEGFVEGKYIDGKYLHIKNAVRTGRSWR
jgi:hypothetical protein